MKTRDKEEEIWREEEPGKAFLSCASRLHGVTQYRDEIRDFHADQSRSRRKLQRERRCMPLLRILRYRFLALDQ